MNTRETQMEKCPLCHTPFNPKDDQLVTCYSCMETGSTACCMPGGNGCLCEECEAEENWEENWEAD